jgi:hypothetical protein
MLFLEKKGRSGLYKEGRAATAAAAEGVAEKQRTAGT